MSRTNPQKLKRRAAKTTLLILGEGSNEEFFLKHLRGLYSHDTGTNIKIHRGRGGSATQIIIDAIKTYGAFDKVIVILDNDKPEKEMSKARQLALENKIDLLENTPCLDAVLLSILNGGKSYVAKGSAWCKSEFQKSHLSKQKRSESNEYLKLFPKELLEKERSRIQALNSLIILMGG